MKSRHLAREIALQILYRQDVLLGGGIPQSAAVNVESELALHFKHFKVPEDLQNFATDLVQGTLKNITELDLLIEKHSKNWKVSRMGTVDRNLLRMSAYEILNFPAIPTPVTIDEAVELAKQFGNEETPAFVNAILDSIQIERKSLV
jgi:transcription antitermination protein NusB